MGIQAGIATPLVDESSSLLKGFEQLNIKVQVKDATFGPRMTRYRVLLKNLNDRSKLDKCLEKLALAMNLGAKSQQLQMVTRQ